MSGDHGWRGRAEDNEDQLTLSSAEDAVVRGAWERASAMRHGYVVGDARPERG